MISYAALLPDSPLLLYAGQKGQFSETQKSYQRVVSELQKRGISRIIVVAPTPTVFRHGFSVWVGSEYEITFATFGDLSTKAQADVWWEAYLHLRSPEIPFAVEPIDSPVLDPSHAVVLYTLKNALGDCKILCVNDSESADQASREMLGRSLASIISSLNEPCALLVCGGLAQTKSATFIPHVHEENSRVRREVLEGRIPSPSSGPAHQDLFHETLAGPLTVLKGALRTLVCKEYSYEKSDRTSFLVAEFQTEPEASLES